MTSLLFDPDSTSKILNLFLLWFNERYGSKNFAIKETHKKVIRKSRAFLCLVKLHILFLNL